MQYNLKIKDYPDSVQVSVYTTKITRGDDINDEDNTRVNKGCKRNINDYIQDTWYNPETNQNEIIPEGFRVIEHPFFKYEMLYPEEKYIDDDVWIDMDYEKMLPIVQKKIEAEKNIKKYANEMRSVRRTKQTLYEIARGSSWELFVTITIGDDDKRYDLSEVKRYVSKRINNVKSKYNLDFKYLLIPEKHKDGAWHLHGLFKEIRGLKLRRAINPYTGQKIVKNGIQVYNIPLLDVVGYTTATYVQNNARVTQYITKYITKEMEIEFPGQRKYLASLHLPRGNEMLYDTDESGQCVEDVLQEIYGYVPVMTYGKIVRNVYTDSNNKYMQFKK